MRRSLVVLAIVAISGQAHAEEAKPKRKRLLDAYLISAAVTSVPSATFVLMAGDKPRGAFETVGGALAHAGLLVGPSAGHWYVGGGWTTGLTLRLVAGVMVGGMVVADHYDRLELGTLIIGGMTALALYETGFIWDLVTLPSAVRRYNREHASMTIVPLVTDRSGGVAIAGTF